MMFTDDLFQKIQNIIFDSDLLTLALLIFRSAPASLNFTQFYVTNDIYFALNIVQVFSKF